MKDEEFNRYCAKVMGWSEVTRQAGELTIVWYTDKDDEIAMSGEYDPCDDLNQMAEVVEKLADNKLESYGRILYVIANNKVTCKEAFRDFIESTADES